ncbi:SGNH/GDSL hydrolase family protein [Chachezhania sediminis]|uniref:SGNH/GDSL hydrolase family protein n=1 Tax=Chachezhania sediminis TaxID=2599291 RepID=UPI00131C707E|nr:SGNH/GDSL hydrolase family protein [Chachezhania sediminis]
MTTTTVDEIDVADELIGNRDGSTGRLAWLKFAVQLLSSGPFVARFNETDAKISSNTLSVSTWAVLETLSAAADGTGAEVLDSDGGTHSQATATGYDGAAVNNAGRYSWKDSWSRWVRIGDTGLSAKANTADLGVAAFSNNSDDLTEGTANLFASPENIAAVIGGTEVKTEPVGDDTVPMLDSEADGALTRGALSTLPISTKTQAALDLKANAAQVDAIAPALRLLTRQQIRAELDEAFSSQITGTDRTAITNGSAATSDTLGAVWRLNGVDAPGGWQTIAPRVDVAVEPGRVYKARVRFLRVTDPADPSGHAIQVRMQNLSASRANVGDGLVQDLGSVVVADGVVTYEFTFAMEPGQDYQCPATTRYAVPFLRIFGGDHETDVAVIEVKDVTDLISEAAALATHAGNTENPHGVTAEQVGLGEVNNTADADKPISTATQEALGEKSDKGHEHDAADISDSTEAGRSILTAEDAAEQRAALGLGTAAEAAESDFVLSSSFSVKYSDKSGALLHDSRGFWFRLLAARSIARHTAKPGVHLEDQRGFTVRLDNVDPRDAIPNVLPLHTNGSGVWALRLQLGLLAAGGSTTARLALFGDSWHQHAYITQAIMDLLYARYGQGADGWISPTHDSSGAADENINDVAVSISGWTEVDVTDDGGTVADPWSITADYLETTGTDATWSATGLRAETIHIYYEDGDGTLRYRIDGGSWVAVAGTDSGNPAHVAISGLSTGATHSVEIDTVGNTGRVRYGGLYCTGIPGVEVSKCGNGGATSLDWARIMASPMLSYILADVDPHAATICLGTNDISNAVKPTQYRAAIESMIDVIRGISPDCGIVLDPPNECFRAGTFVVADYTAQCAAAAADGLNVEFINMAELIGPYASTKDLGIWRDNSHLNALGGFLFARHLFRTFFTI